ncbi:MAG: zf-HC2 domain-containing protein [Lachnospiraceae bacterium]
MREINCNIIRDLLPSYVDDICSEDSRHLIEEHLESCEQCRTQLELLKDTTLIDEQGEQKQIFYLKKIKRHYEKGLVSLVFLTLILIGGALYMVNHYGALGGNMLYMILPVFLIAAYCLMPDNPLAPRRLKFSGMLVAGSILASVLSIAYYGYAIFYFCRDTLNDITGTGPFGVPLNETGPYLEKRLILMLIVQLIIFILSNILIFGGYRIHKSIYGFTITGFWLITGYLCTLRNMSTMEELYQLLAKMTGYLMIEGIVFSMAACIFGKKVLKQVSGAER